MTTLDEAWHWYQSTRRQLLLWGRIARRHWQELPWDSLGKDDKFKGLEATEVNTSVEHGVKHFDDLAVVVLFSLFESEVRQQILDEIAPEAARLQHRVLVSVAKDAEDLLREGSFFHVMKPFKDKYADLVAQVDQVRQYRNWVAHGRRGDPKANVTPQMAFDRLQAFLQCISLTESDKP
jgi:hypothetical protein